MNDSGAKCRRHGKPASPLEVTVSGRLLSFLSFFHFFFPLFFLFVSGPETEHERLVKR